MSFSVEKSEPIAVHLEIDDRFLRIRVADGRELAVPLTWYPKVMAATVEQRNRWRWIGGGVGIHWPDINEDLSVRGTLLGNATSS